MHILEIDEKGFKTKTEPSHVEIDFQKANEIWAQANIFWDLKKIDYVPADTTDFKSRMKWLNKNYKKGDKDQHIRNRSKAVYKELVQTEKHQKEGVIDVYYLPVYPIITGCGVAFIFNKPFPRKEFVIIGHETNPKLKSKGFTCPKEREIILAHELGHLLYLTHDWKEESLMFGIPPGKKRKNKGVYGTEIPKYAAKNAKENYHKHLKRFLD